MTEKCKGKHRIFRDIPSFSPHSTNPTVTTARPGSCPYILTGSEVLLFFKIYGYYNIINPGNQLFFATFAAGIAKSFVCTKSAHCQKRFLVISYNLIFFDGFHHTKEHFSSIFHKSTATVHHRQTYCGFQFPLANTLPFSAFFRCNCNCLPPAPAFCNFPPRIFHHFRNKTQNGHLITASGHIRSFSAGNLSVRPQNAENLVSFLANPSPVGYNRRNPPQKTHPAAAPPDCRKSIDFCMSLRGAKRRGNPHPLKPAVLAAPSSKSKHLGERIATSGCALLAMTAFFGTLTAVTAALYIIYKGESPCLTMII